MPQMASSMSTIERATSHGAASPWVMRAGIAIGATGGSWERIREAVDSGFGAMTPSVAKYAARTT